MDLEWGGEQLERIWVCSLEEVESFEEQEIVDDVILRCVSSRMKVGSVELIGAGIGLVLFIVAGTGDRFLVRNRIGGFCGVGDDGSVVEVGEGSSKGTTLTLALFVVHDWFWLWHSSVLL